METRNRTAYCVYIDTLCQGPIPIEHSDDSDGPVVYATRLDAQREIADTMVTLLQQFLEGEGEFEDVIATDYYVAEVEVLPDGSLRDEAGRVFAAPYWWTAPPLS